MRSLLYLLPLFLLAVHFTRILILKIKVYFRVKRHLKKYLSNYWRIEKIDWLRAHDGIYGWEVNVHLRGKYSCNDDPSDEYYPFIDEKVKMHGNGLVNTKIFSETARIDQLYSNHIVKYNRDCHLKELGL